MAWNLTNITRYLFGDIEDFVLRKADITLADAASSCHEGCNDRAPVDVSLDWAARRAFNSSSVVICKAPLRQRGRRNASFSKP